ncbi:cupin domain-containing protein [uncultured Parasphingorhabdus sp.]|uniref:cupin domain-containing protein n=1 Tax=uncultured Parasphingorhabdus sp. TaxID=2709694 RepID=UPI0030DDDCF7
MNKVDAKAGQSGAFVHSADVETEDLGGGIKRQMLSYGPDIMNCRLWFESGSAGDIHDHFHSQTTYIESGLFLAHVDGEERKVGPGDSVYIQPNVPHGVTCLEAGSLIDSFSPARQDFLVSGEKS